MIWVNSHSRETVNIIYVVKPLVDVLTLAIMKQCTPERNPRVWRNLHIGLSTNLYKQQRAHRGEKPCSRQPTLKPYRKLRVKQEGKQQVFTRRRKPFENSKIVHVREAIQWNKHGKPIAHKATFQNMRRFSLYQTLSVLWMKWSCFSQPSSSYTSEFLRPQVNVDMPSSGFYIRNLILGRGRTYQEPFSTKFNI